MKFGVALTFAILTIVVVLPVFWLLVSTFMNEPVLP